MSGRGRRPVAAPLVLALLLGACSEKESAEPVKVAVLEPADMILHNGNIITVDQDFSRAQAVAITGDTLTAVGDSKKVLQLQGDGTRVIDLKGATVLPGINDAHIHLAWWAESRRWVDLRDKNIEQIQASLRERVAQLQPGEVIRGVGWSEGSLGRMPTREDLDPVTPDNPVALEEMGHALWVNSAMLQLAGITDETKVPVGAKFERNPDTGALTGVFHEADELILPHIPESSDKEKKRAIVDAIDALNRQGVTSLTEPSAELDTVGLYEQLADAGSLSARVTVHLKAGRSLAEAQRTVADYEDKLKGKGTTHNLLTLRGIKLYMDGAPPGRTALMFEDYACCPGERGLLVFRGETEEEQIQEINNTIEWFHGQGFQLGLHVDGDRAAHIAINGLIRAMEAGPPGPRADTPNPLRHYLIHGDLVTDDDVALMAEWQIGLATQPLITYSAGDLLLDLWGQERGERHMATGLFVRAGVPTSISSDAPIVEPDWKQNIEYALLRENKSSPGRVNGPQYRTTVKEAIIAHTRTPAHQDFQDDIKGTIEVGKLADLVIIDRDILAIEPREISDTETLMTILGGRILYESPALGSH
jgi:predicted amidohydrolase YtcJ